MNKMVKYNEVEGDLIKLALEGKFDVISHGCNCFSNMGSGIAPQMVKAFCADRPMYGFSLESKDGKYKGDINKLGQIQFAELVILDNGQVLTNWLEDRIPRGSVKLIVVNSYTQFGYGRNHTNGSDIPLDYDALTLCMRKMNHQFKGKHIGLPMIGAGLGGGDWKRIKAIIQAEFKDCDVTVVIYKP